MHLVLNSLLVVFGKQSTKTSQIHFPTLPSLLFYYLMRPFRKLSTKDQPTLLPRFSSRPRFLDVTNNSPSLSTCTDHLAPSHFAIVSGLIQVDLYDRKHGKQ